MLHSCALAVPVIYELEKDVDESKKSAVGKFALAWSMASRNRIELKISTRFKRGLSFDGFIHSSTYFSNATALMLYRMKVPLVSGTLCNSKSPPTPWIFFIQQVDSSLIYRIFTAP